MTAPVRGRPRGLREHHRVGPAAWSCLGLLACAPRSPPAVPPRWAGVPVGHDGAAPLPLRTAAVVDFRAPLLATVTGSAMGGELRIVVRCPNLPDHPGCLAAGVAARDEIARIEALATDWQPSGEIARLNAQAGRGAVAISPEVHALLQISQQVAAATEGRFDPTIGALWGLWDFEAGQLPDPALLAQRLPLVDWRLLDLESDRASLPRVGMAVTLGGIAQGYAAERALACIPSQWEALVDVSGDISARGQWEIGLQDPAGPRGTLIGRVLLRDASLVTSGDYERTFARDGVTYHHVLDPRTGMPARGAHQATVVHPQGAIADALATALLVSGPDRSAVAQLSAWALVVDDAGLHELGARAAGVDGWTAGP